MKYPILILALAAVMFQTFSKVIIFANYELNKEYISKNLCENRNKPQMNCCGKCQLKKEMKRSADEDSKNSGSSRFSVEDIISLSADQQNLFSASMNFISDINTAYTDHFTSAVPQQIFHPPTV